MIKRSLKKFSKIPKSQKIGASFLFFFVLLILSIASEKNTLKKTDDTQNRDDFFTTQSQVQAATASAEIVFASPNIVGQNESRSITIRADGTAERYRFYIHDISSLKSTDAVVQSYNRTVLPSTFHFLGEATAANNYSIQIQYPTTPGQYKIVANAVNGEFTCSWDRRLMQGTPGASYTDTGQTCNNVSPSNLRVESQFVGPSVDTADAIPNKILGGTTQPILKLLGNGGGSNKFSLYLHGTATPRPGTHATPDIPQPVGSYDPNNIVPQDFYNLGDSYVSIPPPSDKGTYYFAVNATEGTTTCSWDKRMYTRNTDGTVTATGNCNNIGLRTLEVVYPSVPNDIITSNLTVEPSTPFDIVITENSSRMYWVYIHGTNTPDPTKNDPVVQTYDPNIVDADTFYKVGTIEPNTSLSITPPSTPGTYYLVVNGHSDINPTAWTPNDRVCSWEKKVFKSTANGVEAIDTCENPGVMAFTVLDATPSATTTPGTTPGTDPDITPGTTPGTDPDTTPGTTPGTVTSPTQAPTMTHVTFNVETKFPGVGNAPGDNMNPLHKEIFAAIYIADKDITEPFGVSFFSLAYNSVSGRYTGIANVEIENLQNSHKVLLITSNTVIPVLYPNTYNLANNQTISLPFTTLISGDLNNDLVIDMRDYSLLISCYGSKSKSSSCKNSSAKDLNFDGAVGGVDYNILLRHLNQSFSILSEQVSYSNFREHFLNFRNGL